MIEFTISIGGRGLHDAVYVTPDEDPLAALVAAAIQSISTDVEVTVSGVTMHLAAWMDPVHWSEDWEQAGVDDVDALLTGAVSA